MTFTYHIFSQYHHLLKETELLLKIISLNVSAFASYNVNIYIILCGQGNTICSIIFSLKISEHKD